MKVLLFIFRYYNVCMRFFVHSSFVPAANLMTSKQFKDSLLIDIITSYVKIVWVES